MKINEVEKITGLTKKAIRLYEIRGLVSIERRENGYRDYSENDVKILEKIKLLRSAGVSVTDIKLLFSGILSLDEIIDKRKKEIDAQSGRSSEQYAFCETLCERIANGKENSVLSFSETDEPIECKYGCLAVGIDIGTTTISAAVIDIDSKEQIEVFSLPHNSYVEKSLSSEQSVSVIIDKAESLMELIYTSYRNIVSIGITGQMHGVLYIDIEGNAVSNLINWQDKRADFPLKDGQTTCELIKKQTGESIATGYGIATHYYNILNGLVPQNAVGFCSIMDYLGMRLCKTKRAVTHTSIASSFGLFDAKRGRVMLDKLALLGIGEGFLPKVTDSNEVVGKWKNIPVFVAIGDNQASFLGSVKNNRESILVNIGTGSQISAVGELSEYSEGIECRPFINGEWLVCGSALCGGSAYALIEKFFRSYVSSAGLSENSQYSVMNCLAEKAYDSGDEPLAVDTSFCGKRTDPQLRGAIENIDLYNFTPSALILGTIDGMCEELYKLYIAGNIEKTHIVASGGAVRNNTVLRRVLEDKFGMKLSVSTVKEEAATGAALFSAYALGAIQYENGFGDYINYNI